MLPTIPRIVRCSCAALQMTVITTGLVWAESWQPLMLKVVGVEASRGGNIQVFVFRKDGFPTMHQKAVRTYSVPVRESQIMLSLEAPPGVPFALKVHHDEDGNGRVTKNWTGVLPREGLGFSSGARIRMRPPTFSDASMTMPESGTVSIKMKYP